MTRHRGQFPDTGGSAPSITSLSSTTNVADSTATLTWAASGATYVYLDQNIGILPSGTTTITVPIVNWPTTFKLSVANAYGDTYQSITVSPNVGGRGST